MTMTFTDDDRQSPTWKRLRAHIETQIAALREKNDSESLTPEKTAALRGEIKALKKLLALENPAPAIVVPDSN